MNILVVDDDPGCCKLLEDFFRLFAGSSVTFANNGAEAWWSLSDEKREYDLAIIDLRMPVVDGLALLTRIRQTPHLKNLRVMICSGVKEREVIARAAQMSILHYIAKPYELSALHEKIDALFPYRSRANFA